jgi:hypothetical protein
MTHEDLKRLRQCVEKMDDCASSLNNFFHGSQDDGFYAELVALDDAYREAVEIFERLGVTAKEESR